MSNNDNILKTKNNESTEEKETLEVKNDAEVKEENSAEEIIEPKDNIETNESNNVESEIIPICADCGNKLEPGQAFCSKCGKKVVNGNQQKEKISFESEQNTSDNNNYSSSSQFPNMDYNFQNGNISGEIIPVKKSKSKNKLLLIILCIVVAIGIAVSSIIILPQIFVSTDQLLSEKKY